MTDEPLCEEGKSFLREMKYPALQAVYISPMRRCAETAEILFPDRPVHVIEELAECDFGDFENKNYEELTGNPEYQAWIESGGTLPFPGGESREAFCRRNLHGFRKAMTDCIRSGAVSYTHLDVYKRQGLLQHWRTVFQGYTNRCDRTVRCRR